MPVVNSAVKESPHREVVSVRVEQVQSISEADAIAEGIFQLSSGYWAGSLHKIKGTYKHLPDPVSAYQDLWISINGKESWDSNPWVWGVEFQQANSAQ